MAGEQRESWWLETSRGVGGWRPAEKLVAGARERQLLAGEQKLVAGPERRVGGWRAERQAAEVGVEERRGSQHQTLSREARRQDRVQ